MSRLTILVIIGAVALFVLCGLPLIVGGLVFNMLGEDLSSPDSKSEVNHPFLPPSQRDRPTSAKVEFKNPDECLTEKLTDLPTVNSFMVVDRVIDGDTLLGVESDGPVRLWGIDAPELEQPGGEEAARHLASLATPGKVIRMLIVRNGPEGMQLVILGGQGRQAINNRMVADGWAFHVYSLDSQSNSCLYTAQRYARDLRSGLWAMFENGGVRPWDWRRGVR